METETLLLGALILALLSGALLLLPRALRTLGFDPAGRPGRRLAVIEATAIDQRRRLVLVRCDGRELLLLVGGASDGVVGWLPALPTTLAAPFPPPAGGRAEPGATDDLA